MPYFRLNQKALKQYVISNDNIDLRGISPLWVGQGRIDQPGWTLGRRSILLRPFWLIERAVATKSTTSSAGLLLFSVVQLDFL